MPNRFGKPDHIGVEMNGKVNSGFLTDRQNSINTITIPKTINSIEALAFETGPRVRVELVTIPSWVTSIGFGAFTASGTKYNTDKNDGVRKVVIEPGNLRHLDAQAFYRSNIEELTIGDGVISSGGSLFSFAPNLKSVVFPSTLNSLNNENDGHSSVFLY